MLYPIFILFCCPFLGSALENKRDEKSFSLFSVLKWKNTACQAVSDADLKGVCYTKQECDDNGGTEDGNCAAGFGTCCVITVSGTAASPGGTVTQNCSFIENVAFPSAETNDRDYEYLVTKCSTDICQVRLDFLNGNFAQPDATTGNCETTPANRDTVTLDAGGDDPNRILCGDLTGQHVYMDVSPTNTNAATITIATKAAAAAGGTKNWRIKVSQIECDSEFRAPQGCAQMYFDNVNTITSFNWDGNSGRTGTNGGILASQDYKICIKQNKGMCSVEWTPSQVTGTEMAFQLNAVANAITAQHQPAGCDAIIQAGAPTIGQSFVQIPGAAITNAGAGLQSFDTFCGQFLSDLVVGANAGATANSAVIANSFELRFVAAGDGHANLAGFSLEATQRPCGSNPSTGIQAIA